MLAAWQPFVILFILAAGLAGTVSMAGASDVASDEHVVLYPTYGRWDETTDEWVLRVLGRIFEPEPDSWWRRRLIKQALQRANLEVPEQSSLFERRLRLFLVDHERGKRIQVRIAGNSYFVGNSGSNGYFASEARISGRAVAPLGGNTAPPWVRIRVELPEDDPRELVGGAQLIPGEGISVISDIDDTVRLTGAASTRELLRSTFLEPFRVVSGMPETYQAWAERGAVFHYVSASPWQLAPALEEFFAAHGLPAGSLHLRHLRLWDRSVFQFLRGAKRFKLAAIEQILADFPDRRFLLVGDSTQHDPVIYAALARRYPAQIAAILIREAKQGDADLVSRVLHDVDEVPWHVFEDPDELQAVLDRLKIWAPGEPD